MSARTHLSSCHGDANRRTPDPRSSRRPWAAVLLLMFLRCNDAALLRSVGENAATCGRHLLENTTSTANTTSCMVAASCRVGPRQAAASCMAAAGTCCEALSAGAGAAVSAGKTCCEALSAGAGAAVSAGKTCCEALSATTKTALSAGKTCCEALSATTKTALSAGKTCCRALVGGVCAGIEFCGRAADLARHPEVSAALPSNLADPFVRLLRSHPDLRRLGLSAGGYPGVAASLSLAAAVGTSSPTTTWWAAAAASTIPHSLTAVVAMSVLLSILYLALRLRKVPLLLDAHWTRANTPLDRYAAERKSRTQRLDEVIRDTKKRVLKKVSTKARALLSYAEARASKRRGVETVVPSCGGGNHDDEHNTNNSTLSTGPSERVKNPHVCRPHPHDAVAAALSARVYYVETADVEFLGDEDQQQATPVKLLDHPAAQPSSDRRFSRSKSVTFNPLQIEGFRAPSKDLHQAKKPRAVVRPPPHNQQDLVFHSGGPEWFLSHSANEEQWYLALRGTHNAVVDVVVDVNMKPTKRALFSRRHHSGFHLRMERVLAQLFDGNLETFFDRLKGKALVVTGHSLAGAAAFTFHSEFRAAKRFAADLLLGKRLLLRGSAAAVSAPQKTDPPGEVRADHVRTSAAGRTPGGGGALRRLLSGPLGGGTSKARLWRPAGTPVTRVRVNFGEGVYWYLASVCRDKNKAAAVELVVREAPEAPSLQRWLHDHANREKQKRIGRANREKQKRARMQLDHDIVSDVLEYVQYSLARRGCPAPQLRTLFSTNQHLLTVDRGNADVGNGSRARGPAGTTRQHAIVDYNIVFRREDEDGVKKDPPDTTSGEVDDHVDAITAAMSRLQIGEGGAARAATPAPYSFARERKSDSTDAVKQSGWDRVDLHGYSISELPVFARIMLQQDPTFLALFSPVTDRPGKTQLPQRISALFARNYFLPRWKGVFWSSGSSGPPQNDGAGTILQSLPKAERDRLFVAWGGHGIQRETDLDVVGFGGPAYLSRDSRVTETPSETDREEEDRMSVLEADHHAPALRPARSYIYEEDPVPRLGGLRSFLDKDTIALYGSQFPILGHVLAFQEVLYRGDEDVIMLRVESPAGSRQASCSLPSSESPGAGDSEDGSEQEACSSDAEEPRDGSDIGYPLLNAALVDAAGEDRGDRVADRLHAVKLPGVALKRGDPAEQGTSTTKTYGLRKYIDMFDIVSNRSGGWFGFDKERGFKRIGDWHRVQANYVPALQFLTGSWTGMA